MNTLIPWYVESAISQPSMVTHVRIRDAIFIAFSCRESDLQTRVTLRSSRRRARPAIANQDFTYSTFWNPVSMVTLVPVTLPCT
jgi:hypothetical protein